MALLRRLGAEALGTVLLLAVVVGSGIMGERLSQGNDAIALLGNSIATGCGLFALILVLGPVSGAHFNPVVTLIAAIDGKHPWREVAPYVLVQVIAAIGGVILAHAMYDQPLLQASPKMRTGSGQWIAEGVATFGLVLVILGCARIEMRTIALAVAAYITAAYWFTASTSFANPAVTIARSFTATFAGIRPDHVAGFIAAQLGGGLLGLAAWRLLSREDP